MAFDYLHVREPVTEGGRDYAERALQSFLEEYPSRLGISGAVVVQSEYQTEVGRIDLLVEAGGDLWVVELKAVTAGRDAIGQVISYMGAIQQANPGRVIYGMLVAPEFDKACLAAHSKITNLQLCKVAIEYRLEKAVPMQVEGIGNRVRSHHVVDGIARCFNCGLERRVSPGATAFTCSSCRAFNQI
jgi:RecB family endonuclease NucS